MAPGSLRCPAQVRIRAGVPFLPTEGLGTLQPCSWPSLPTPGQIFRGNGPLARPPALGIGLQDRPRRIHLRLCGRRSGFLYCECGQNLSAVSMEGLQLCALPFPGTLLASRAGWQLRTQGQPALFYQQQEHQGQVATLRESWPGLRPRAAAAALAWARRFPAT